MPLPTDVRAERSRTSLSPSGKSSSVPTSPLYRRCSSCCDSADPRDDGRCPVRFADRRRDGLLLLAVPPLLLRWLRRLASVAVVAADDTLSCPKDGLRGAERGDSSRLGMGIVDAFDPCGRDDGCSFGAVETTERHVELSSAGEATTMPLAVPLAGRAARPDAVRCRGSDGNAS